VKQGRRALETTGHTRRDFARRFALGGSAALLATPGFGWKRPTLLEAAPRAPGETYWAQVRKQFLMPPGVAVLNAANLCPSSAPVLEAMYGYTKRLDREPSPAFRNEMHDAKEVTRRIAAEYLRATPEEILLTRNTSESNNLVSSGIDLKPGDEIVLFEDNHPSNLAAWVEKAKRWGFTIKRIAQVNPHPGLDYYLDAFARQITQETRLIGFTHVTSTVGDAFPARALCRLAAERGVMSLVDGAQSFGALDVDLSDMQPDFYSGSAHKWPCGPKEAGVLFVHRRVHARFWPSVISAYPGVTGLSKTHEGMGQRDEPALLAFGESLKLQQKIGMPNIERRSHELATVLIDGLQRIDGVKVWTTANPQLRTSVVSLQPGTLDPGKLTQALFEKDGIICATRAGADRSGVRFSPHFYNSHAEVERAVAAIRRFMTSGV
jgi:isopenicillin-N epimerase